MRAEKVKLIAETLKLNTSITYLKISHYKRSEDTQIDEYIKEVIEVLYLKTFTKCLTPSASILLKDKLIEVTEVFLSKASAKRFTYSFPKPLLLKLMEVILLSSIWLINDLSNI